MITFNKLEDFTERVDKTGSQLLSTLISSPSTSQSSTFSSSTRLSVPSTMQQEEYSSESLITKVRSLVDIYESCNFTVLKPENYEAATKEEVWNKAMEEEIKMIEKNNTWELVDRPKNKEIIGVKWVYKSKLNSDGSIKKCKARLVANGYSQLPGIDYNETFALVARLDTIRTLIALATQKRWRIYQLDVKFAFLNGVIE